MPQRSDLSRDAMKKAVAKLLLNEPLADITVRQIVTTAQVARSTFYRNFEDKDDFLAWLQNDLVAETSRQLVGTVDHPADLTAFYTYAQQNREFMKAFLVGQRWPAFVQALYKRAAQHTAELLAGQQDAIPDKYLGAFGLGGHINMFATWLRSDEITAPATMAAYHRRLDRGIMAELRR